MLVRIFEETAARHPDRLALVCGPARLSWVELRAAVAQAAGGLAARGIGPGDWVALWLPGTPAFVVAYLAALARGAGVLPLNPASRRADVSPVADVPRAIVTSHSLEVSLRHAIASDAGSADATAATPAVHVCPDGPALRGWNLLGTPLETQAVAADAAAVMQMSSGATGRPKVLVRTHGQCAAEIGHFRDACGMTERDVILCALPLFHAHGMANALWAALGSGACLVLQEEPQPFALTWPRALQLLGSEAVTVFPGVPLMFKALAEGGGELAHRGHLRLCFSAGTPLPRATFDAFRDRFGVPVRQLYGCTEAGSVAINLDPDAVGTADSVGRPMPGVAIEVRDAGGAPVPAGTTGEIAFRSRALASGYLNDADLTRDRFRDGWFLTGDIGRIDAGGRLVVVGRKEFVVEVGGHKVYLNEVEDVLAAHPGVAAVAVIGVPDARTGQSLKAFVVPRGALTAEDLRGFARQQLAIFKRPLEVVFVTSLPKTPLGKVARDQLV